MPPPVGVATAAAAAVGRRHLVMVVLLRLLGLILPVWIHGVATKAPPSPAVSVSSYFLSPGSRNITATVGQTAYLPCRVAQLANQAQVSWIRKRDLHVISSGIVVFASDQRFQVVHPEKSENWTLQIRFAQMRDAGVYECQVNSQPKMSLAYNLAVVEAQAKLLGPEYVRVGSTINLTCIVTPPPASPGLLYWYHNGIMLDYEGPLNIKTQESPDGICSSLTIGRAAPVHSGNYTC